MSEDVPIRVHDRDRASVGQPGARQEVARARSDIEVVRPDVLSVAGEELARRATPAVAGDRPEHEGVVEVEDEPREGRLALVRRIVTIHESSRPVPSARPSSVTLARSEHAVSPAGRSGEPIDRGRGLGTDRGRSRGEIRISWTERLSSSSTTPYVLFSPEGPPRRIRRGWFASHSGSGAWVPPGLPFVFSRSGHQ